MISEHYKRIKSNVELMDLGTSIWGDVGDVHEIMTFALLMGKQRGLGDVHL